MRKRKTAASRGRSVKGRLWIDGVSGTFIGFGRVVLLERIRRYGSITKAAKSMKISYRHAWELVNSMNTQSKTPLVTSAVGGKRGGGTTLTDTGERAIKTFWGLYKRLKKFLDRENEKLDF